MCLYNYATIITCPLHHLYYRSQELMCNKSVLPPIVVFMTCVSDPHCRYGFARYMLLVGILRTKTTAPGLRKMPKESQDEKYCTE